MFSPSTATLTDTTTNSYNPYHELAEQVDPDGDQSFYSYDANGNVTQVMDGNQIRSWAVVHDLRV